MKPSDEEQNRHAAVLLTFVLALMMLALMLAGCATTKPIKEIEYITKYDSIYITKIDHQIVKDSVYIKDKGDTLYVYKYRYIDRYKVDTIIQNHTDTIYKTETKIEYVEKSLTSWQKARLKLCNFLLGAAALLLLALGIKHRKTIIKAVAAAVEWLARLVRKI